MKIVLGLLAGALCAALIACGGAQKSAAVGAAPAAAQSEPAGLGDPRDEIARLDQQIDADFGKLGVARPAVPMSACIEPPCDTVAMSSGGAVSPSVDPACKPAQSEACTSSCKLSESICVASGRICKLASQLGGGDRYANEKCASGQESCKAAHARCCGCQL